ncbi:MAG: hypothetical protein BBJ60_11205 [Desulfobacterales bacterium S7086C20]|jgi:uncharacterized membrane protein YraQ (UPF0718 family)|nr:MAG: hypothetical protein BBJ60_11205 [Desulfobacterales bacterium S7086C20]
MSFVIQVFTEAWHLFLSSAVYVLFGILVAGLLRVFINPSTIAHHLGRGRFLSVVKAALFGIPIPL